MGIHTIMAIRMITNTRMVMTMGTAIRTIMGIITIIITGMIMARVVATLIPINRLGTSI